MKGIWVNSNSFSKQNLSMQKLHHINKAMGDDVFYGNDDCEEMNECIYKDDVLVSMRRARELKALKKNNKKQKKNCYLKYFECFRCLWFLLGCGTKSYD
ncbi:hypothetical protein MtrunA17_Chr4g0020511 [Medicago truncatula]|uniref:Uncharacterized protein n=1 Tax=Medicago truncatula TaxID=3880 RepID=A0A072TJ66_MEDTR|nr:hypothetical protein MTR_0005s0160 [Medicago truncatula]RHN60013.1 hypothetical protein MtrunA17_Chr4g0020511 [Medicago truncatula]